MPLPASEPAVLAMGLISLDYSVLVQMGLLFILFLLLQRLLFKPALETIRLREERTIGSRKQADELRAEAEESLERYESALRDAKRDAVAVRRELREEGAAKRDEALDAARADSSKLLDESRADLEAATVEARAQVDAAADALSGQIVARLLGRAAVLALFLLPAAAWASGGGGEGWQHGFLVNAGWTAANVVVLLWVLAKIGKRPARDFLANRRTNIMLELDEATKLREEAEALLDDYKGRVEGLDAEKEQLLAEFRDAGEAEKTRLVDEGKQAADRMRADAKRSIDQEIRKAKVELEGAVLDRAVAQATEALRKDAGPSEQRVLVDDFLGRVKSLPAAEA